MDITVTVSQLNRRLSLLVKGDSQIRSIAVRGEISNFTHHYKSGHIYFTLREGDASIKAVMFRGFAEKLDFEPEDGMNIIASGSVQLYERDGTCQLYVSEIRVEDEKGAGLISLERLKEKLEKEGLFAQKRPLPPIPESVCVVTSDTGAALQDILNVLSRRFPLVKVTLVPVLVQGAQAPESIARGLETAQRSSCDLIIFGRGGGSAEDLSAFNSERVARAVYASRIPTISAVGHEIDFTIADLVADKRAPTPSAAAELAVPDIREISEALEKTMLKTEQRFKLKIDNSQLMLRALEKRISLFDPENRAKTLDNSLKELFSRIRKNFSAVISLKQAQLNSEIEILGALNPMKILERGYSVVYKDGQILNSAYSVKSGEKIKVKMKDGEFDAEVL